MKVFIISDIGTKKDSIIPYGLNLGKHNESETEIVHIIDPRSQQGVSSPYSDSQSITPGVKMSHEEIKDRDQKQLEKELDKLLSAEASRLNFPLKVNKTVDTEDVEPWLKNHFKELEDVICLASAHPENSMVTDLSELVDIFGKLQIPLLIVPPGYAWREPAEISLYTNYAESSYDPVKNALQWYETFPMIINAINIVEEKKAEENEEMSDDWRKAVNSLTAQSMIVKTGVTTGKNDAQSISKQIRKSAAGLVMIPKSIFSNSKHKLKKNSDRVKFINDLKMPVLIY